MLLPGARFSRCFCSHSLRLRAESTFGSHRVVLEFLRASSCTAPKLRGVGLFCFSGERLRLVAKSGVAGATSSCRLSTFVPSSSDALSTAMVDIDAAVAGDHDSCASEAELSIMHVHEIPRHASSLASPVPVACPPAAASVYV